MTATISTDTKKINYKSDFDFIARLIVADADGATRDLGFPDFDWEMRMSTGCNGYTTFVASSIGGKLTNCINDGGQLRIICNNHGLRAGVLYAEFHAHLPNAIYPDGDQLVVTYQGLGIELVLRDGESDTSIETELQLPIIGGGSGKANVVLLSQKEYDELEEKQQDTIYAITSFNRIVRFYVNGAYTIFKNYPIDMDGGSANVDGIIIDGGDANAETILNSGNIDIDELLTKDEAEETYAKKDDIPTKVSELDNDKEYITIDDVPQVELPDNLATTDDLAKKQDTLVSGKNVKTINGQSILGEGDIAIVGGGDGSNIDLSGYLTKDNAEQTYAKKTDIPSVPTKVGELQNDKGYITLSEVPKTDLSDYATKEQLNGYQPKGDYALKSDIPSVPTKVSELTNDKAYITLAEVPETDLSDYAKTADVAKDYQPKGDYATTTQLNGKQDKLTSGEGISIENNVISCTLDTSLYVVVSELPDTGVANKIYLIESNTQGEQNIYTEYAYVNNAWERLGEYRAEIDLAPYLTKTDAESTYQPKGDYALASELPTKVSALENDANYVDADTLQEKIDAIGGGTSEKEILMMKAYLFDFSGTYTQAQIESSFKVTFDELIAAIKNGNAIVITSSGDTSGNYNIVFGATYTLLDDAKTLSTLSMMWWQYSQWVTLSLTYNSSSSNYTAAVTKTAM